jgi:probable selenium-dependent hydroxylase accessory protein YqeC
MVSLRDALMLGEGGVISLVGAGGKTSLMFRLAHELEKAGERVLTTTTTKIYEPSADQSAGLIVSGSVPAMLKKAQALLNDRLHVTAAAERLPGAGKLRGFAPEIIQDIWNSRLFRWIVVEADGAAGRPLKVPADHEPVIPACTSQVVGMVGLNCAGRRLSDQVVFRHGRFIQLTGLAGGSEITESAIIAVLEHEKGIFKNAPAQAIWIAFFNQADSTQKLAAGQRIAQVLIKKKMAGLQRVIIGQTLADPPVIEVYDLNAKSEYETELNQTGK